MKLLLLHAGGTLMMQPEKPALGAPLVPAHYVRDLVSALPVLTRIAEIDTRVLYQLDSSDMQPEHWIAMAEAVHDALPHYDGVVVVHGTDTMAYTASALAFLLPDLDRPVILTGSQRPLSAIRSDARQNLVDAFLLATRPVPEVCVAFASRLLRGCRATKVDAWGLSAFDSPCCQPLAELGVGVDFGPHVLPPRPYGSFDRRLEPRVLALRLFPGLEPELLLRALERGVRGVVLEAFGAGNVPSQERSLVPVVERATAMGVPVVVVSQCPRAHVDLSSYAGGVAVERAGATGAGDMTAEAALTKLMVVLGRVDDGGDPVAAVREAFARSWVGEMTSA